MDEGGCSCELPGQDEDDPGEHGIIVRESRKGVTRRP